ncbi:hypothetical protein SAMN05421811_1292 [Nonomuraea wenchangensis]|uniref:Uncharacterized protein n=1 Tax=Nonomuraea wenchangensis TaxID=568860 RepID=A0A1I0LUN6_9ACTN|nr:hypothetical protein SAMN05421811_1292 [Nonomuraea wenchangensis]
MRWWPLFDQAVSARESRARWTRQLRQALSLTTSALRHFPDILAARASDVVAIDAKTHLPASRSRRYAISRDLIAKLLGSITRVAVISVLLGF